MSGLCACGCGERTTVARQTSTAQGWIRGQPLRWVAGHQHRKPGRVRREDHGFATPCLVWQLSLTRAGYARTYDAEAGRKRFVHVIAWERLHGPVPDGHELDHLCRVKACVDPAHLEPVTHAENVRRGVRARAA